MKIQLIRKDPDAGKDRRQDEKGMRQLDGISNSMDISLSSGNWWRTTSTGKPGILQSMDFQRVGGD